MDRREFLQALRALGFEEKNGLLWGTMTRTGPRLMVDYSDDGRPTAIVPAEARAMKPARLGFHLEPVEIDGDFHFSAAIIGEDGSDEYVHVLEDGPYFDHVFLNLHDEGLSTVEDLADAGDFDPRSLTAVYSDDAYEDVGKQTRIEWQPFFQNPVALSLKDFLTRLARTG